MAPQLLIPLTWTAAYLIGAIPFGYLVARSRGVDIFAAGSGNIGATNVGRVLGRKLGVLVFVLDLAKGVLGVALALAVKHSTLVNSANPWIAPGYLEVGAGLAAFLGHCFPIYLGFRGGKGVATGAGVVLVLMPMPALVAVFAWLVIVASTRFVSLASVAAAFVLCGVQWSLSPKVTDPRTSFGLLAGMLVLLRHRANISRLLQGSESRVKESAAMTQLPKILHLYALALWFGMTVFFSFAVALSLFHTFQSIGELPAADRPAWFPLPDMFARADDNLAGPREQGSRVAGTAVAPIFPIYFLLQGICALVALVTALAWSRQLPDKVHHWRVRVLLAAFVLVLIAWPVDHKVSELRVERNRATEAYLQSPGPTTNATDAMKAARADFGLWHQISLLLNLSTILFVTIAVAFAAWLPASVAAAPSSSGPPSKLKETGIN